MVLNALLLAGCLARQAPEAAPSPLPVATLSVLEHIDGRAPEPVPGAFEQALAAVLGASNLPASPAAGPVREEALGSRTLARRLEALDAATTTPLVLVVETSAEYFSQLNGRYRWTVSVRMALAQDGAPGGALLREFGVPVFLEFHHEREPEALVAAAPLVARKLEGLVGELLSGAE